MFWSFWRGFQFHDFRLQGRTVRAYAIIGIMKTPFHGETPRLHDSQSAEPFQPGEVVYDHTFELCGYKFYVIAPSKEEQPEPLRRALQMYGKTEDNVRDTVRPKRNLTRLGADIEAKLASSAAKVYDVIVKHTVVAWQSEKSDSEAVFFTPDEQEKLSTAARRQVCGKIVELFRME